MDVKDQNNIELLLSHDGTTISTSRSATSNPTSSSTALDRNIEILSLISSSSEQEDNMQGLPPIRRLPRTYLEEGGRSSSGPIGVQGGKDVLFATVEDCPD